MTYDADVIVIGSGPAGLAAAIRLRWVKGSRSIPCSVLLLDPDEPGGLAALGGCVLTGPSWTGDASAVLAPLLADARTLQIPQRRQRALGIEREGELLAVLTDARERLRCLAVIVATGFRALHGEARRFGSGVDVAYKSDHHLPVQLERAAQKAAGGGLALVGHAATLDILPFIEDLPVLAGGVDLLLQPPVGEAPELPPGVHLHRGRTLGYLGEGRLTGVSLQPQEGPEQEIPCAAVLVDYHAFERRPEASLLHGDVRPGRDARGFLDVDAHMRTSEPGVFAAGDVTGRYASTVMAMGDGVCAGFSAYRHVHRRKYGREPELFAYAATGPTPPATLARPPLPISERARLVLLAAPAALRGFLQGRCSEPATAAGVVEAGGSVAELTRAAGLGRDETHALLRDAMNLRLLTVHQLSSSFGPLHLPPSAPADGALPSGERR